MNPYSTSYQDFHPDGFSPVVTSPTALALGTPFGFLSVRESQWAYLVLCFLLAILTARLVFRAGSTTAPWSMVLVVAGLMIVSRPGVDELLGVGLVFPVVFGFAVALQYARQNSLLSGCGFLVTTCSLVFAVPLAVLMLFRRDFRGLAWGLFLTVAVWVAVVLVLARGNLTEIRTVCLVDLAKPIEVLLEDPAAADVDRACWERIDLTPTVTRIVEGDFLNQSGGTDEASGAVNSLPLKAARVRLVSATANPATGLAGESDRPKFLGGLQLGTVVAMACLAIGAICLLLEKRRCQREGLVSRSGLLIVLITLLALPHPVSHGLLVWLLLVGLLVGFRNLVAGLHWSVRFLVVVLLIAFVFNFLSPQLVLEPGFLVAPLVPDSWQMDVLASLNPILLTLACLLVGLSCLASQLSAGDPPEPSQPADAATSPDVSDRQRNWEKLRGK
ncbi:MAG: DUF2029 domain-containing protein [Mariniblastus sp.]|nr:DUF2029 domain-containing protein [Mariniblastus sp.]